MDDNLQATTKYYQVSVTFHASSDVEYYYLVQSISVTEAKVAAIDRASKDLHIKQVESLGDGMYEVVINFKHLKNGDKYYTISASTESEAAYLAKQQAKKCFTALVIFYEEENNYEENSESNS